jgi:hypothetical protein
MMSGYKKYLLVIIASIFSTPSIASDWSTEDYLRQSAITAELFIDYRQTEFIVHHCNYYEHNEFLGKHPGTVATRNYFGVLAIGSALISNYLPPENRKLFQYTHLAVEFLYINHNRLIGIHGSF